MENLFISFILFSIFVVTLFALRNWVTYNQRLKAINQVYKYMLYRNNKGLDLDFLIYDKAIYGYDEYLFNLFMWGSAIKPEYIKVINEVLNE